MADTDSTWWWSAPGSPASTRCIACAGMGLRARVLEAGERRRRHVVLEPLPGRALRRGEPRLPVLVLRGAAARVALERALPRAGGDPPLPRARRGSLRPAPRHLARARASRRRSSTRTQGTWTVDDGGRRGAHRAALHHGDGLPVGARRSPRSPGRRRSRARSTTPAAGRTRASTSRASASRSSGPARRASSPSRSSPSRRPSSSCSSARRTSAPRPGTARWTRRPRARSSPDFDERRRRIRESMTSLALPEPTTRAPWRSPTRSAARARGTLRGGRAEHGRRVHRRHDRPRGERARRRVLPRARSASASPTRRSPRRSCRARYPWGTKRPCVDTDYYETFNRESVTLVDLRSEPLEEIVADGVRTRERTYRRRRHRLRDRLRRHDRRAERDRHPRPRRRPRYATSGPRARGPTSASGSPASRTCSSSRAPAARRCSATWSCRSSSTSTGSPTRSATCASTGLRTIEPTAEAQDAWVAHVAEIADFTLVSKANSWYMGANVPGKPRVFMPYLGGVGPYAQRCEEIAAAGYEGFALA